MALSSILKRSLQIYLKEASHLKIKLLGIRNIEKGKRKIKMKKCKKSETTFSIFVYGKVYILFENMFGITQYIPLHL